MTLDSMRDEAGQLWCVVAAEPQRDAFANANLREAGFVTWWPHYRTEVTRRIGTRDRKFVALRGLFAGYLFAALDAPENASEICSERHDGAGGAGGIKGVDGVVRAAGKPLLVRPRKMDELRQNGFTDSAGRAYKPLNAEGLFETPEWAKAPRGPSYAAGERVRLTAGSFDGFIAVIGNVIGSRVDGVLEELFFGNPVRISIDARQVERAPVEGQPEAS